MKRSSVALLAALGCTACEAVFGIDFDDAHSPAGAGGAAGSSGGSTAAGQGWTKLELLDGSDGVAHSTSDFVNAIWCAARDRCVVATEGDAFEAGNLYAASHEQVTAIVLEGNRIHGSLAFIGLSATPSGLIARIDRAEPLVVANMDFTTAAGWSAIDPGDLGGFEGKLNPQMWFQTSSQGSQLALANVVMVAPGPPGSGTVWSTTWQPPSVPSNFIDLLIADPMLCTVGPDIRRGPAGWVSDDLQLVAFAVGNGLYDDHPGACVSIDGAETFRYVPLPSGEVSYGGPHGLRCNDAEHCWLFGDGSVAEEPYVYYAIGALDGGLTWKRASIPDGPERRLKDIAFAPDHLHGWLVGTEAPGRGLLLGTEDGGKTWSDNLVAHLAAFEGAELLSVFALDEHDIWVGGRQGLLMSNGRGGR
jgi:hypothetical protein